MGTIDAILQRMVELKESDDLLTRTDANGNPCCYYCGSTFTNQGQWDHVFPKSHGGSDSRYNLVWTCPSCNSGKLDNYVLEWLDQTNAELPANVQIDLIARLLLATRDAHDRIRKRETLHSLAARLLLRLLTSANPIDGRVHIDATLDAERVQLLIAALDATL